MTTTPRFDVEVQLSGESDNAFFLVGTVRKALRRAGATAEELQEFTDEATSDDYDNVLQTCFRWVHVV